MFFENFPVIFIRWFTKVFLVHVRQTKTFSSLVARFNYKYDILNAPFIMKRCDTNDKYVWDISHISHLDMPRELRYKIPYNLSTFRESFSQHSHYNLRPCAGIFLDYPSAAIFSNKKSWRCEIYSFDGEEYFTPSRKKIAQSFFSHNKCFLCRFFCWCLELRGMNVCGR